MFTWTDQSVTEFIAAITDELIRTGANADNGLKKQQWTSVLTKFNENRAVKADKDQLQSKYQMLKKKYTAFKALKDNSGFGWDTDRQLPTAPDEVWDRYLVAHKEAKEFRYKTLPNFAELDDIFTGNTATGNHAIAVGAIPITNQIKQEPVSYRDNSDENIPPLSPLRHITNHYEKSPAPTHAFTPNVETRKRRKTSAAEEIAASLQSYLASEQKKPRIEETPITLALADFTALFTHLPAISSLKFKMHIGSNMNNATLYLGLTREEKELYIDHVLSTISH